MIEKLRLLWALLRDFSGDDAYERYLEHYRDHHRQHAERDEGPLSKAEFFKQWQEHKWQGVKRCC